MIDGWDVTLAVNSEHYPGLSAAVLELRGSMVERDAALRAYVQALP